MSEIKILLPTSIDEEAKFEIIHTTGLSEIIFDCENVKFFNSIGIREFSIYSKKIPEEIQIEFVRCKSPVIRNFNMVTGLLTVNSSVGSFYVPYFCDNCNKTYEVLLENNRDYNYNSELPKIEDEKTCVTCSKSMEVAIIAKTYLKFFQH